MSNPFKREQTLKQLGYRLTFATAVLVLDLILLRFSFSSTPVVKGIVLALNFAVVSAVFTGAYKLF
ncbi:hypothetical protein SAMN04244560_01027 [Thermoanaerobacter thermohydrosulfuricus]|jgi:chromate transport protein ChrA|uniref:Uncharacterized protein n=1 Tax=Thermoanaerobacter thermohydrosulfuricus TaxID=1516 RepID=A0A1G7MUF8_THETY|nr:hypothetical protein [Thermoanaerobacter thermohydrosulfuricus]SDF65384.1 hypothetical protein SAMN04244560_01027 [Thermoanaerobacter thermohydrosulfuricus]